MFNDAVWAEVLRRAYGWESREVAGVLLFNTRRGEEMNPLGDYIALPKAEFFKLAKADLRVDKEPRVWNAEQNLESYRLGVSKNWDWILKNKVHQKQRNLIKKAEKSGVVTREEFDLRAYYKIYVRTMLRIGAIPQSYKLFEVMQEELGKRMKLFVARKDGKAVAGVVALVEGDRLWIWSNASAKAARAVAGNMGCYAGVLQWACEQKSIKEVDFGSTKPGSSLAFFKKRFGAEVLPLWTVSPDKVDNSALPKWPAKVLSLLPVPLVSWASSFLFRHIR